MRVEYTTRAPARSPALVASGRSEAQEGRGKPQRGVVVEFPSYEQALACYRSAAYQEASSCRAGAARSQVIIVEGMEP